MSTEANKALVRRVLEEVWGHGQFDLLDQHLAPTFVEHFAPPGLPPGPAGYKQFVMLYRNAMPDYQVTLDDIIAEGDLVVARWTGRGTHQGELFGIPPTGKPVTVSGITMARIEDGQGVEAWTQSDNLGVLQQLGAIPPPGQAAS